ncbi:PREDICTED: hybrid signal transduction histidine kinase M-like [Ceratosolen solmsi marchali]|uniref:Hybrid signal transduction histidine kinase M-like n=1 Tax=Ceratosolen solmsi marchali TaxID=326594 RepID=A0AAJ6YHJ0_9HYME|nr:PREDICTED: hybrid signal transduction histidine kinase M-like [Ceratosolen solmsi marchali]
MDKQNLLPNFLSSSTYKLTKAASFSELSTTKKVVIEQQQHSKEYGNLIKQYSCEQIFDKKLNSSLVKVSCKLKSDNEEHNGTWNSTVSVVSSLANLVQGDDIKVPLSIERQYSSSSSEYFDLKESNINFKKIDISNKNNFYDYEESINENCNKSKFEFKRPTLMIKKSRVLNGIDNVIHDNYNVNKNNLSELLQRNTCKNSNQNQKIDTSKLKEKLRSLVVRRPKEINDFNCSFQW